MEDRESRIENRDLLSSILILLKNPMNASTKQHERKISNGFNRSTVRPEVLEG